jgi:hypothetical protein
MKIYGKVILLVAALIMFPAIAFTAPEDATTQPSGQPEAQPAAPPDAPPAGGPPADQPQGPPQWNQWNQMGPQGPDQQFPILNSDAFKEEVTRHTKAVADIMAPLTEIRQKLADDIKALQAEYFPAPVEGQPPAANPTPEKIKEYQDKVTALLEDSRTKNADTLKDIGGKLVDEFVAYNTAITKIATENKDKIVDVNWKNLLTLPRGAGMGMGRGNRGNWGQNGQNGGQGRWGRRRGNNNPGNNPGGNTGGNPEQPAEPAQDQGPGNP